MLIGNHIYFHFYTLLFNFNFQLNFELKDIYPHTHTHTYIYKILYLSVFWITYIFVARPLLVIIPSPTEKLLSLFFEQYWT
jgi:hypothetical protein